MIIVELALRKDWNAGYLAPRSTAISGILLHNYERKSEMDQLRLREIFAGSIQLHIPDADDEQSPELSSLNLTRFRLEDEHGK